MRRLDDVVAGLARRPALAVPDADLRQAAVAVLLAPDPDRVLVILRATSARDPWSGHLALPGGRREVNDSDLVHTAIRETFEETGLLVGREALRATMSDITPRLTVLPPILVRPFIFLLDDPMEPVGNEEVAHAAWVPLVRFMQPGVFRTESVQGRGAMFPAPGYRLDQGFLWGMTERILTPVLDEWAHTAIRPTAL